MEILEKLFGGVVKVRIIRLFMFNPDDAFSVAEIAKRIKSNRSSVRKELNILNKIDFLKKKSTTYKKRRTQGFTLNPNFPYLNELKNFLTSALPISDRELLSRLSKAGKIKLVILSGIFLKNEDGRVDMLIVGDGIRARALQNVVESIEADMGREILYAAFETSDFKYRLSIYDKLIRDIFDYPHIKVRDKISIPNQV